MVYLLRAVHQEIRDTDMALRAEDYRKGYLLARLGTETDLLPDEELLGKEMRDLEKQTAVLREQQQAAHAQVLRFKDTVEEELYESDSGEDEASVAAVCSHRRAAGSGGSICGRGVGWARGMRNERLGNMH